MVFKNYFNISVWMRKSKLSLYSRRLRNCAIYTVLTSIRVHQTPPVIRTFRFAVTFQTNTDWLFRKPIYTVNNICIRRQWREPSLMISIPITHTSHRSKSNNLKWHFWFKIKHCRTKKSKQYTMARNRIIHFTFLRNFLEHRLNIQGANYKGETKNDDSHRPRRYGTHVSSIISK